ncbi:MAG: GtrA family protein [Eubacteriales bacterium]|nr:GtrA family protein [Eubacteriales bacterium]
MTDKIKAIYIKYRELIAYVFCGGLTTLMDFGVYMLLTDYLFLDVVPSNIIAWAAAVLFAFTVNKIFVFEDRCAAPMIILTQFISFASMRAASGGFSTFVLWLFTERYGFNDICIKALTSIAVIILNYIFSKLIIFKNKNR